MGIRQEGTNMPTLWRGIGSRVSDGAFARASACSRTPVLRGLLAIAMVAMAVPAAIGQSLESRIDSAISGKGSLQTATVGVHVRDARTGKPLYSHAGDTPLIPASNMKLLTTGAALRTLGPDASFETRLGWAGTRVLIIGDGDPGLGDPALLDLMDPPISVDDMIDRMAQAIASAAPAGIGAGEIIVDDRVFERERVHPSWPVDQLNRWYCAEVAGLNFHTNCLTFFLSGTESDLGTRVAGVSPFMRLQPRVEGVGRWLSIANNGETVASGRNTAWVARAAGARPANEYTIFGNIRLGGSAMIDVAVHEPPLVFASLLAERLERLGVPVRRDAQGRPVVRLARDGERFGDFETAAVVRTAMADVLRRSNTNSQNLYTEALLKRVGHEVTREPGSWTNGSAVVRMLIADDLGPEHASRTSIADGSGMSRENRVAPDTLTAWLGSLLGREQIAPALLESMPGPGEGTLRRRFGDASLRNRVFAKSGTLNGVRCLSGYVITHDSSQSLAFSVMVNDANQGKQIRDALDLHEEIVGAIDGWLSVVAPSVADAPTEPEAVGG